MTTSEAARRRRVFNTVYNRLLLTLCDLIIPADERSPGAIQAGAPEFISLLASENPEYFRVLSGGFLWLNATCKRTYGCDFVDCAPDQQRELLDLIAYRETGRTDMHLGPAKHFFAVLRKLVTDAFFTSEIGMLDLQYLGNTHLSRFEGCPLHTQAFTAPSHTEQVVNMPIIQSTTETAKRGLDK
jgi:hypothetical protein